MPFFGSYTRAQEWSEPLALQDAVVLQIGLQLTDNLSLPWQDGISFRKTNTGSGTVAQIFITEDLLMAPQGDKIAMLLGMQMAIAETLTLRDAFFYRAGDTIASTGPNFVSTGENLAVNQAEAVTVVLGVTYQFAESMNAWLDEGPGVLGINLVLADNNNSPGMADALAIGYGEGIVEQLVFSDSSGIGYGFLITDQMTMSESVILGIGAGITETLTVTDGMTLGYGLQIADNEGPNWSDAAAEQLGIALILSDNEGPNWADALYIGYGNQIFETLSMADSTIVGFGEGIFETLTISDQMRLGYGLGITDQMTMSDAVVIQLSIALNISETLTISDSMSLGYGLAITDSLTMTDAVVLFMTESMSIAESLSISDQMGLGYGLLISDTMTMSDAFAFTLGGGGGPVEIDENLSDQLVMADAEAIGYGNQIVEQLIFQDSTVVGYGLQIADQMAFSDQLVVGYGNATSDQLAMSDSTKLLESMLVQLVDATPAQLDALSMLFTYGLQTGDVVVFQDQLAIMYGLMIGAEQMVQSDSLTEQFQFLLTEIMADSAVANWLDGIILQLLIPPVTPGLMDIHSIAVVLEAIGGLLTVAQGGVFGVSSFNRGAAMQAQTQPEVTIQNVIVEPQATIASIQVAVVEELGIHSLTAGTEI